MDGASVLNDVYKLPVHQWTKFFSLTAEAWREYLNEISSEPARQKVVAEKLQDEYRKVFFRLFDLHNYIQPGEYRYCNQGWHLLWDHGAACPVCTRGKQYSEGMEIHAILVEERLALALKRLREGLPPLFWMKK